MKTYIYICRVINNTHKIKMKNLNLYSFCNWSSYDGQGLYVNLLKGKTGI